jgi:large subunit ribosomal protein L20
MRIKRGVVKKRKHSKILKSTKGYRQSYSKLYRRALQAHMHAGVYSFVHRHHRRGQFRKQWIQIIAAGLTGTGMSYNKFVHGLSEKGIELDRKVLAEIIQTNPEHFATLVEQVK